MCSIIGYCGRGYSLPAFTKSFNETISRGPDDTRVIDTGKGLLGFHRLAIMGLEDSGMQPFTLNGNYVVCNGEIYGFEKLRAKLGVEMFRMLDSEFACIIYDSAKQKYIAARDPIGIRPLYYGYDKNGVIVFASEPKNLVSLVQKIIPFPPGHYYKDGLFIRYCDITEVKTVVKDDLETICENIREKLIRGIEKRLVADAPLGFLLSGGLDSSLVCAVSARLLKKPIRTFAIGMDTDAIDLKYAKEVAEYIHSEHTEIIIDEQQVLKR